ncbi:hypothetical protein [Agrobacterium sp. lyk4-40-TYG-31]|uniref:hypothetical protein n=1 Tax=Agrobacterium sp. lyk4-40-TYG-31 TaxID=3040276 RepID=UPI0025505A8F|nr:hypothetical protein [Agrobacterium sp. lyk4-40-TYG-31]
MTEQGIKFIGDMQRLVIKPGDRFVIKCDQKLSISAKNEIAEVSRGFFGEGVKVLILEPGMSLGVVGE